MTMTFLVWTAVTCMGLCLLVYLGGLAIEWFLDAEHRALKHWLDDHQRQIRDGEENK